MSNAILGLVSGKTFADNTSFHNRNNRRRIFHDYPVGQFPLTGLLSLMEDEESDSFEFGWWEKRFRTPSTTVAASGGTLTLPFGNSAGANLGATAVLSAGTSYTVAVADDDDFLVRNQIWIQDVPLSNTTYTQVKGVITAVVNGMITFFCVETTGTILNSTNLTTGGTKGPVGAVAIVAGTVSQEGSSALTGRAVPPSYSSNLTQIFRDTVGPFTRSALKQPATFDKTGLYRETAEDALRAHMTQIEMAFLFGTKRTDNVVDPVTGETTPRRMTGGVVYWLEQWEAANSVMRGGSGAPAVTLDSDDNKRIISAGSAGTAGTMTWAHWNTYLERAFRCTNDKSFEKIFMCGSGFLAAVNAVLETRATLNKDFGVQKVYGMNITTWETSFGTVHFKTHPLFSQNAYLRNSGLLLDIQNLRYRPLNDSDTTLLDNRQARDYDGRKDEWITEAGLEVNLPESCMFIKNLQILSQPV
jgi:hypothetical protein